MSFIKNIIEQWKGETPKMAKRIRNICATIAISFPSIWITFQTMNIALPNMVSQIIGYVTLISLIVTGIAGTKETLNAKAKRLNKE